MAEEISSSEQSTHVGELDDGVEETGPEEAQMLNGAWQRNNL